MTDAQPCLEGAHHARPDRRCQHANSAGGYAAYTLMPGDTFVLTVEFKVNFLAPADGGRAIARGHIKRAGKTISVCEIDVDVENGGRRKGYIAGLHTSCSFRTYTAVEPVKDAAT